LHRIRLVAAVAIVIVLLFAVFWSVRLAEADLLLRNDNPQSIGAAIRLAPLNARYYVREAYWLEQTNLDDRAIDANLSRAAQLNPRLSTAWMNLALREEMRGHTEKAESLLLQAGRVDRLFKPAWTLANFYFRSGQEEKFWPQVRACFDLVEGRAKVPWAYDPEPLYDLCWRMTSDADKILRVIPPRPEVEIPYLRYLENHDHLDAAATLARRAIPRASAEDVPVLVYYLSALFPRVRVKDALEAWNLMIHRGLISDLPLDPARGVSLTNGNLAREPANQAGFDWQLPNTPGVTPKYFESPPMLRFDFDGDEAEHCEFLQQYLPVVGGQQYVFDFEYKTTGIAPATGLQWHVADVGAGVEIAMNAESLSSEDWKQVRMGFTVPETARLARLALRYDRQPGTVRIKGSLSLRNMTLGFGGTGNQSVNQH
jgi:tetratricopeptide (TPR) repeat protein